MEIKINAEAPEIAYQKLQVQCAKFIAENEELKNQLFSVKPTCNNCGHCDCENYQMQRKSEPCALWISHKDQLSKAKENIQKLTKLLDIAGDYFYEDEYLEAERFLRGVNK